MEEHNIMAQPRHSLIGSIKGENTLLATPLLKWYLEHSLEVTKVYQVIEFTPRSASKRLEMLFQMRGEQATQTPTKLSLQIR